jgi:methyl-accepting chemotaxis protein
MLAIVTVLMLIQIIVTLSLTRSMNSHMKDESNKLVKDLTGIIEASVTESAVETLKADVNELSTLISNTKSTLILLREYFVAEHHAALQGSEATQVAIKDVENFCKNAMYQLPQAINGIGATFERETFSEHFPYFLPYAYRVDDRIIFSIDVNIEGYSDSGNIPDLAKQDYMDKEIGLEYYTSSVPKNFNRDTESSPEIHWTEPYVDYTSNVIMISGTAAVNDNGKTVGVVFVDLSVDRLTEVLKKLAARSEKALGFTFSLKSHGILSTLGLSEYAPVEEKDPNDPEEDSTVKITDLNNVTVLGPKVLTMFENLKTSEAKVEELQYNNESYTIIAYNESGLFGIVILIPHNELYADTTRAQGLMEALYSTQEEDLRMVQIITITSLILVFAILSVIIIFVLSATRKLSNLARNLDEVALDINLVSKTTSKIADELDTDSREQLRSLSKTSDSMKDIISQIDESVKSSELCWDAIEKTTKEVAKGDGTAKEVKSSMDKISNTTNEISKILHNVQSIAFQTNLLALNASVEAARAGELGQGFAVVAGEVRSLSLRSNEAAQKTDELMEVAVDGAKEGEKYSVELISGFERIGESAENVSHHVQTISHSSQEQKNAAESISHNLDELNDIIEMNNNLAQKSLDNSHALESKAEVLISSAEELKELIMGRNSKVDETEL